jgi:hypothetical protein
MADGGAIGHKGDTGDTGSTGIKGDKGDQGPIGLQGPNPLFFFLFGERFIFLFYSFRLNQKYTLSHRIY